MYNSFLEKNSIEKPPIYTNKIDPIDVELNLLFDECGGVSINGGLYRVHTANSCLFWSDILNKYFPNYSGTIYPFGFDWLGRQYCVSISKRQFIIMLDPSTVQGYEIQQQVTLFHNQDLVENKDETVSENEFEYFLKELNVNKISYKDCIAQKIPLFLGGTDDVNNFQISDMEVYWETQYQIYRQIKDLPPGTKINSVKFE